MPPLQILPGASCHLFKGRMATYLLEAVGLRNSQPLLAEHVNKKKYLRNNISGNVQCD